MIGDWVQCKGKNICLTAGHLYEVSLDIYKASPYQPIPLTPEILERIEGCEKCFRIDIGEYKECYEVDFALGLMIRHNSYYIDWIGGNTEVKYLHTLQQFIRLFTNKEIEIEW